MFDLFHLGQKVVYVAPYKHDDIDEWGNTLPTDGKVYTIRGFVEEHPDIAKEIGLLVEEIVNEPKPCAPDGRLGERAWKAKYFRPVEGYGHYAGNKMRAKV